MSLYTDLKEARSTVKELEAKINQCAHDFLYTAGETTTFKTTQYSPMDGILIEGPYVYGFIRRRSCNICGLTQKSESRSPQETVKWEDT